MLVAKALVHQPPIIILDEPTAGVDVELRGQLWDNVKSLNKQGVTIILTTHYLAEAEEMCDRIGILNKGKLVALDTTKNLLKRIQTKKVTFAVNKEVNINNNSLNSLKILSNSSDQLIISYEKSELAINEIIKFINEQHVIISDISTDDECDNDKESKDTLFQEALKSECYSYSTKINDRGKVIGKMRENFRQNQDEGNIQMGLYDYFA